MKIVIFSDTHLTDNFEYKKYKLLRKIILSTDRVIINGDFWDSWFTDFDKFVNSEWKKLFPLLLKKKTIYLYGNHDPGKKCDKRVKLFSIKSGIKYELNHFKQKYHIEHGHRILSGKESNILKIYGSFLHFIDHTSFKYKVYTILHFLEYLGYKFIGTELMTDSKFAKNRNKLLKHANQKSIFLICGDTHCAEIDKKNLIANTGCINYGSASYLIIEKGAIALYKTNY